MTIDEAIAHAREVSSRKFDDRVHCIRCSEFHEQLAEWLEELKILKSLKNCSFMTIGKTVEQFEQEIRDKTIDDFAETLIPRLTDAIYSKDVEGMRNLINDVAEQLKAGGEYAGSI